MEVYGASGLLITSSTRNYRVRFGDMKQDRGDTAQPLQAQDDDVIHYVTSVVRGRRKPNGLTGLSNNLIVTEILQAARESAQTVVRLCSNRSRRV